MPSVSPVFAIVPTTQSYDWGKKGASSKVAQLAEGSKTSGFTLDENKPYAELWMGTHSSSPSHLITGETLASHLAAHPDLIGDKIVKRFNASNGNLPFLFKVLSIEKALSIQTHPDKSTAEKLHAEHPGIYKDDNHKPEMALALTPFTALCGFLPLDQIATHLSSIPEFSSLIPSTISEQFVSISSSLNPAGPNEKKALRDVFSALMTANDTLVKEQLNKLTTRYAIDDVNDSERGLRDLILRLNSQFPGDIGVFCPFMLNYVTLEPGEAIYLGAGEPHAYVTGDIMECMANSDNVIRAGLTPKLRDIPNLVSGLTYEASRPSKHVVQPDSFHSSKTTQLYEPPIPEFSVLQVNLEANQSEKHPAIEGPSIAIVIEGAATVYWEDESLEVSTGSVLFIGAGVDVSVQASKHLTMYRAYVACQ